jgi:hypothetical protein
VPKFEHTILNIAQEAICDFNPDFLKQMSEMEEEGWTLVTAYALLAPNPTHVFHYFVYRRERLHPVGKQFSKFHAEERNG